ncbi:DNA-directed RNA polymerase III subunit rpc4-like [Neltuma alba]|uniref:DNA-directed RNA polymerase III subunit rpc4-like n=1 Tax=Neltuma alba TaxID=207710 RepID=UPI0010A4C0F9|nr:DNA-directed RNA polymerase III subunit rpc4-like [Prosopis alba]
MDGDQPSSARRKVKFAPRSPPTRKPKPKTPKSEAGEENDGESAQARALLRHMSESITRRSPKVETKANVQVAFGPGASSSPSLRTYGNSKGKNRGQSSSSSSSRVSGNGEDVLTLPSTAVENQNDVYMIDATNAVTDASARKTNKEYREPWDYQSYYPTTLPLRKPNSGNPEILDEQEFGEAATSVEYDEEAVNNAAELGLLDDRDGKKMLLFQLPPLPLVKQPASVKGKEKLGTSEASIKGCNLEDLSGGYMGKMLVYKSGAVKLKLGENLFDVSVGSDCLFAQDVVAMEIAGRNCCVLGELNKRAVVTPDDFD